MPSVEISFRVDPEILDEIEVVVEGLGQQVFDHVGGEAGLAGGFFVGHAQDCTFEFACGWGFSKFIFDFMLREVI